jgi:UDP-glucose 4-epimerase
MKASISGIHGFIGSALNKRLLSMGWQTYSYIRPDVDYVFLFGSPSSNILFNQNIDKCVSDTINSFLDAIRFCRDHNIKLVYPSSATVHNRNNNYAHCKAALEEIQAAYNTNVVGIRIFAGYGVGEAHKKDYASVVYQFCQLMKNGASPVIFGDGTQSRDFIYIDDIIDGIIAGADETGIIELGSKQNTTFNRVVKIINNELKTNIIPIHIGKPSAYVEETPCRSSYIKTKIDIETGIRKILNDKTL